MGLAVAFLAASCRRASETCEGRAPAHASYSQPAVWWQLLRAAGPATVAPVCPLDPAAGPPAELAAEEEHGERCGLQLPLQGALLLQVLLLRRSSAADGGGGLQALEAFRLCVTHRC